MRLRNLCTTPDLDHDHHSFEVHCSLGYDQCWVRAENNLFSLTATSTGHCPEKNQDYTYSLIPSLGINWYVSLEVVVSTVKNIVFVMSGQEQDNSLIHTFDAIVLNHEEVQKFHTSLISYFVFLSILWGVFVWVWLSLLWSTSNSIFVYLYVVICTFVHSFRYLCLPLLLYLCFL